MEKIGWGALDWEFLEIEECKEKDFRYRCVTCMFEMYKDTAMGENFVRIDV